MTMAAAFLGALNCVQWLNTNGAKYKLEDCPMPSMRLAACEYLTTKMGVPFGLECADSGLVNSSRRVRRIPDVGASAKRGARAVRVVKNLVESGVRDDGTALLDACVLTGTFAASRCCSGQGRR